MSRSSLMLGRSKRSPPKAKPTCFHTTTRESRLLERVVELSKQRFVRMWRTNIHGGAWGRLVFSLRLAWRDFCLRLAWLSGAWRSFFSSSSSFARFFSSSGLAPWGPAQNSVFACLMSSTRFLRRQSCQTCGSKGMACVGVKAAPSCTLYGLVPGFGHCSEAWMRASGKIG